MLFLNSNIALSNFENIHLKILSIRLYSSLPTRSTQQQPIICIKQHRHIKVIVSISSPAAIIENCGGRRYKVNTGEHIINIRGGLSVPWSRCQCDRTSNKDVDYQLYQDIYCMVRTIYYMNYNLTII